MKPIVQLKNVTSEAYPPGAYPCLECDSLFSYNTELNSHIRAKHSPKGYECELCLENFSSSFKFKVHMTSVHGIQQPFKCDVCGNCYARSNALRIHSLSHSDNPPVFPCTQCQRSFTTNSALKTHLLRHSTKMAHVCSFCKKAYNVKGDLRAHVKIHQHRSTFYECLHCKRSFQRKANMVRHMRKHTGEKPYKCRYCVQQFSRSENWMEHERTHTREKPFVCGDCGVCFSDSGNFSKHRRIHKSGRTLRSQKEARKPMASESEQGIVIKITNKPVALKKEKVEQSTHCIDTNEPAKRLDLSTQLKCPSIFKTVTSGILSNLKPMINTHVTHKADTLAPQKSIRLPQISAEESVSMSAQSFLLLDQFDPSFSFVSDRNLFLQAASLFVQHPTDNLYGGESHNAQSVGQETKLYAAEEVEQRENEMDTNRFLNDAYLTKSCKTNTTKI